MQDSDGYIWMGPGSTLQIQWKKFSSIQLPLTVRNRYVNYLLEDSKKESGFVSMVRAL
jgi:hypothetical protein